MRVKSIVIDGFKSYAHRKELADLSPHFNAITGLNGSGKSNIFDAICFVMGITSLKRVRADDPRELIFRAGTTGVHAARVTIEFINDDPATAPPGYSCQEYPVITIGRQIKLGGRQQFFLNNTVSMQSKVKRFFESISLNVDNPHFMILQGTVHQLIGMKSLDILSLIEEAVGTRAFDHRRRTAEMLIRSKERKLLEIQANMDGQIYPMLEAMRADQAAYQSFLQLRVGWDEKERFRTALTYYDSRRQLQDAEAVALQRRQNVADAKAGLQSLPQLEEELTRRLMTLQERLGAPGEAAAAIQAEEDSLQATKRHHATELETNQRLLQQTEALLTGLRKEQAVQQRCHAEFARRRQQHEALLDRIKQTRVQSGNLKKALQLLDAGVQASASGVSLAEERRQIELGLIEQRSKMQRYAERVVELEQQVQHAESQRSEQGGRIRALKAQVEKAQSLFDAAEVAYRPLAQQQRRKEALETEVSELKREHQASYDAFQREAPAARSFDLNYNSHACPPGTEQQVLGRVGELVFPKKEEHALGLMVGAQSLLLRVVVADDAVAEAIIKSGLRQRTAFIAMNKLQKPRLLEAAKRKEAERIAAQMGGWVAVARDLVAVKEASLHGLADLAFGSFFVCSSLSLAQELAYNTAVRVKSVSIDGEVAEPNGLITGGSTKQLRNVFAELQAHAARRAPLQSIKRRMQQLEEEYHELRETLRQHQGEIQTYKAAAEALDLAKQRLDMGCSAADGGIADLNERLGAAQASHEKAKAAVQSLELKQQQVLNSASSSSIDASRREVESQLATAEAELLRLTTEEDRDAADFERLEADTELQAVDLNRKQEEATEDLAAQQSQRLQLTSAMEETVRQLLAVQERYRLNEERRQQLEQEIEAAQEQISRLAERRANLDNLVKNGEAELRDQQRSIADASRHVRDLEQRHSWLLEVQEQLNQPDGPFYFDDKARTTQILQELREGEARANVMAKRMTQKSAILYEDRRREYEELEKQRAALSEDKEAIELCIQGIEAKKWAALDRMVSVVSSIFGKLFAACLPGATAELVEERDSQTTHLRGLGVRVFFNGKQKASLSELSGGQRSLLALCLILAILRVRPAPLYILDEVDAALDPRHTQNIGRMLQLYFPQSQFLLVSLKDGMFSNANVVYHVRNTQGYSEVARIENRPEPPEQDTVAPPSTADAAPALFSPA